MFESLLKAIPIIRRPFYQRDAARAILRAARDQIESLKFRLQANGQHHALHARELRDHVRATSGHDLFFVLKDADNEQDRQIGEFRAYVKRAIKKEDTSLEIGPSYNPIIPKGEGYNVSILDHDDQAGLVEKYTPHKVDVARIEPVDFVWRDGPLGEMLADRKFDDIVAAHVIEHAPDLVQFLSDCSGALVDGGHLYLLVPDKRYCFDYFQPISDVAKILGDHRLKRTRHSFECYYRNGMMVMNGDEGAWGQLDLKKLRFLHGNPKSTLAWADQRLNSANYEDAHENYFTPISFWVLVEELRYHRMLDFEVEVLTRSRGCEFLIVLKKSSSIKDQSLEDFLDAKMHAYKLMMAEDIERIEFACRGPIR
jgi:2-polyprenyl-3-methyl-5-hydroxy-6-metoxy-1,4-benzoquinol methylase